MTIMEHSETLLRIRSICLGRKGAYARFDRTSKKADIILLSTIIPVGRHSIPFADIETALVRKKERNDGNADYGLTLRRRRGANLSFACRTRDEAMDLMRKIVDFLEIP